MEKINIEFPVVIYENLVKYSQTLSKARCRIFYKGLNRNNTFISEEFAQKLIASLPYTPVKGIYDNFEEDYTDHGVARECGRIYGIVPENPNVAWEQHLDEDGVERNYLCCDVLVFSALYEEANEVVGKSQSMELYPPSIVGSWQKMNGQEVYVFEDGCFLGLQILGDKVEPCFEGAAFFSLYKDLTELVKQMEEYSLNFQKGGQSDMSKLVFKLSDNKKHDMLWSLLNSNYNEEGGWSIEYGILDIYDDYALTYHYETGNYERIYYTKNDESDTIEITNKIKAYVLDVTEAELHALEALRAFNGGTYELIDEKVTELHSVAEQNAENCSKIIELEAEKSTLITEQDELFEASEIQQEQIDSYELSISELTYQVQELQEYKTSREREDKQSIISSYSELLSAEILDSYTERIDTFDAITLDKELTYELKNSSGMKVFTQEVEFLPKEEELQGLEKLLAQYNK